MTHDIFPISLYTSAVSEVCRDFSSLLNICDDVSLTVGMALDAAKEVTEDCKAMLLCMEDEISAKIQCLQEEVINAAPPSTPITPTEIEEDIFKADGGKDNGAGMQAAEMEMPEIDGKLPEVEDEAAASKRAVPSESEEAEMGEAEDGAAEPGVDGQDAEPGVDGQDAMPQSPQDCSGAPSEDEDVTKGELKPVQSRLREMARKTNKSKKKRAGRRVMKKSKKKSKTTAGKPKAESAKPAQIPEKMQPAVKAKPKVKGPAQQKEAVEEIKWAELDDEKLKKKVHSVVWRHRATEVEPS